MPALNSIIFVTNDIQNIDQWKIYRNVNNEGYQPVSENEVDYICPWEKVGEIRVYNFNASYNLNNLNVNDTFTLRFNPAGYDNIPEGFNDAFIFESNEYIVTAFDRKFINVSQYIDNGEDFYCSSNISNLILNTAGFVNFYGKGNSAIDSKRVYLTAGKWHNISGIGNFLSSGTDKGIGIHVRI